MNRLLAIAQLDRLFHFAPRSSVERLFRSQILPQVPSGTLRRFLLSRAEPSVNAIGLGLSILLLLCGPGGIPKVAAQNGSPDLPQTRLAPLANFGAPANQGFQGAQGFQGGQSFQGGQGFPNTQGFAPQANSGLVAPSLTNPPSGSLFDPYAAGPSVGMVQPTPGGSIFGGLFGGQTQAAPGGVAGPVYGGPLTVVPQSQYGGPAFGTPGAFGAPPGYVLPPSAYPSNTPSTLFPGGLFGPTGSFAPAIDPSFNPYRLIQRARFRHTHLFSGEELDDIGINDTDVALAFAIPQFLYSSQPLFIAPSFSLHLWDGPSNATAADLPPSAYSAFVDFGWQSNPNQIIGVEFAIPRLKTGPSNCSSTWPWRWASCPRFMGNRV